MGASPGSFSARLEKGLVPVTRAEREVKARETKAEDITTATAGDIIAPMRLAETIRAGERPLRIRSLLTTGPSTSSTVEYVEESVELNAAETAESGSKPKSGYTTELLTATAKNIAHYFRISEQMLKDAGQSRTYIDSQGIYGLDLREDNQLLWGDGTGANLTGILNTAGIQDYATGIHADRGEATDTIIDKVRRAATNASLQLFPADGVVLHPIDWEACELTKGSDEHYIWVNVTTGGEPRLFRLPVVESAACANPSGDGERHAIVGSFKLGAALFDVEGANIELGWVNDDFIKNMKRIRVEKRVIFVVWRPAVFVDIETVAASS